MGRVLSPNLNNHIFVGLCQDQAKPVMCETSVDIGTTIENFEDRFHNLRRKVVSELIFTGVKTFAIIDSLTSLPLKLKIEYEKDIKVLLDKDGIKDNDKEGVHVQALFFHLNPLFSFIDYELLEYIIKKFGSTLLKRDMETYCSDIQTFMKVTTIKQLINYLPGQTEIPPKFSLIEAKIGRNASECTLEQLNTIRRRYCGEVKLSEIVLHLVAVVASNSFIIRWLVPLALVSDIMKFTRNIEESFFQEYQITFLTLDGMWLFICEAEIDGMWSQVHVSDTKLQERFCTMYKQILCELKIQKISEHQMSLYLKSQKYQQRVSDHLSRALLLEELPASLVDFAVLTTIIEGFGSVYLKGVMRSYCKYMSSFTKQSTAQQLVYAVPAVQSKHSEHFKIAKCRIMEEPSHYGLEKLLSFHSRFCKIANISEICFVMDEVSTEMSGSFTVSWLVPSVVISDLMKSIRNFTHSFYQEYKITSLTLEGMWLFLSEDEIDAMWSQIDVSDTKFKNQFHIMYKQIVCELEIGEISEQHLLSYFKSQKYQQHNISDDFSRALLKEELPASLVDFRILTAVIEKFGSVYLKGVMRSYCKYMSIFTKQSTAQQLIYVPAVQSKHSEYFKIAKCRFMEEPSHYRLEKLFDFQSRFCMIANFSEVCFVMGEVSAEMSGSFTVSWLVPSALISALTKSTRNITQSIYQEYEITSLTLDGMWLLLSEAEIDAMWSQMYASDPKFKNQFYIMYKQIMCELEIGGISEHQLSTYLIKQRPKLQSNASVHLNEAFLKRNFPLSVLDFRILKIIIERFGSDCLKKVMQSYCNCITSIYTKQSTAQQLIDLHVFPVLFEPSKYFISAECRIMKNPSEYRLEKLLNFQARFCSIVNSDDICFIMYEIMIETSVSFIVSWLVSSSIAFGLLKSANQVEETKLFKEYNIASLHLGSGWLYHHQLTPFGIKLKEKYQQSQGSPSPVEWIPSPTKKIFQLAMIQTERVQRGHIDDRFVRMNISGRVDDILHVKSPVELEHILRNTLHGGEIILIEGAPGSGKSTLTVHICQRWGKGDLFQQFTIVILVQLRDPAVQRAQIIADLLPIESAQEVAAELIATNGRGVLWILDGWDELPPHLQQNSIFRKLIKRMLSECSVIVTSRPISSGDLHPVVSSRIRVLGFTLEEQRQYFTECLKGDTKALEALLEKIQENPIVHSISYLPLNAAFIVHSFKIKGQFLASSVFEIYLTVILSCIQQHFERGDRGHNQSNYRDLISLNDLSRNEAVREPFQCLCELAYRGVMENKVTFSSSDLHQGFNTLSLLQVTESFLQSGKSVFYNFLHLSIQEVLSAYYIATTLSENEQVSQFLNLFTQPRFSAVFQFYAAITKKLNIPRMQEVIAKIVKANSQPLLVSLLHCLHEVQDPSLCLYVAERLKYKLDLSDTSLSPLDSLGISYFLSCFSDKDIRVRLGQFSAVDLCAEYLTKYLSSDVNHASRITISESDVSHIPRILYFIENLYLSGYPIGDTGVSLISKAVRETATLKTLILFDCGITSKGAENLATSLAHNNSLKKLDIGWNSLKDEGVSHIAEALKQNTQLKELWIGWCGMSDRGVASLSSSLRVNNSLKVLDMGGANVTISQEGLSTITRSLANNSDFVRLGIPNRFYFIAGHLSREINELRKRNELSPIEIEGKDYVNPQHA